MTGVSSSSGAISTALPTNGSETDSASVVSNADGTVTITSPGGDVVATLSDALPVVAIPVAILPDAVEVALVIPVENNLQDGASTNSDVWSNNIESAGDWTAQKVETGKAIIDIDSVYRLSINDVLAEVILENRETNVTTRIWGNAQVAVNGQDVGQFWGTSSFELANGTLITAHTVVSPDNSFAYMLDKLVITRDECGFVVTGISSETVGDMDIALAANAAVYDHTAPIETVTEAPHTKSPASSSEATTATIEQPELESSETIDSNNASEIEQITNMPAAPMLKENTKAIDAAKKSKIDAYDMDDDQRDGLVFMETATGWVDEWDDLGISAEVLAQTMPGEIFGPNSDIMSRSEFGAVISRFVSIMTTQSFIMQSASNNSSFQSQMRDTAREQDRAASEKQASERAARERIVLMNLIDSGTASTNLLSRYYATEQLQALS